MYIIYRNTMSSGGYLNSVDIMRLAIYIYMLHELGLLILSSYEKSYAKLGFVSPMVDATRQHQNPGDGVQPFLHGSGHHAH